MILHNDKEIFNELIETTAGVLGIPAVFIGSSCAIEIPKVILIKISISNSSI